MTDPCNRSFFEQNLILNLEFLNFFRNNFNFECHKVFNLIIYSLK